MIRVGTLAGELGCQQARAEVSPGKGMAAGRGWCSAAGARAGLKPWAHVHGWEISSAQTVQHGVHGVAGSFKGLEGAFTPFQSSPSPLSSPLSAWCV